MAIERLDFTSQTPYIAVEAAIHLNRYLSAKEYVRGRRVLDVACGEGYGSKLLKDWGALSVVGMDVSGEAIAKAKQNFAEEGITFLCGDAEQLPFDDKQFDLVVSFETIEHLEYPEDFLREIARVKTEDAIVVISCPNDHYYAEMIPDYSNEFHKARYHFYEFQEIAEKILGQTEEYYFGFAADGYINFPIDRITMPEHPEAMPKSMTALFDYSFIKRTVLVPAERYTNQWNSNYYLAVWNGNSTHEGASVAVYPRESFGKYDEIDPLADVHAAAYRKQIVAIEKKYHTLEIEKDRTAQLLRLANEEKAYLWRRIDGFNIQINEAFVE